MCLKLPSTKLFQVGINGIISVGFPILDFVPHKFPTAIDKVIAPFWGDVDTRNGTGTITYGETTDATQLQRLREQIMMLYPERKSFVPAYAFIATWDSVGYYNMHSDLVCEFCFHMHY